MEYIIRVNDIADSNGNQQVEEMRELVRCKDCKHYNAEEYDCNARVGWFLCKPDWFCADGDKKQV